MSTRYAAVGLLSLALLAGLPEIARAGCPPLADPLPGAIPAGPFTVTLSDVVSDLVFPIDVAAPDDGSGRLFVTLRDGRIVILQGGVVVDPPLLDITATTVLTAGSALSSVALHPGFAEPGHPGEGKLYTVSQEAAGSAAADFGDAAGAVQQSVVYEWRISDGDPDLVDPASKREIIRFDETQTVHNVDELVFGPDGFLYITKGDDDATSAAVLDGTTDDGAIFRIDVDAPGANGRYRIPPDNPFVADGAGRIAEVWAYGFRNPWRAGFDRNNGVLYVADIGEDDIEEINVIEPGLGYGWIVKEGSFAFLDFDGVTDDPACLPAGFESTDPLAEYDHSEGDRSITGGFVYRGTLLPELVGHYVFGDWSSGRLFHMAPNRAVIRELAVDPAGDPSGPGVIGFAEDTAGELLIVYAQSFAPTGRIVRVSGLTSLPAGPPPAVPDGTAGGAMMTVLDRSTDGAELTIGWDTVTCPGARGYQILYGSAADLPASPGGTFGIGGSRCNIGVTSPYVWQGVPDAEPDPPGLLWWLVVAQDGGVTEGSWGTDSGGNERFGPAAGGASAECGIAVKDTSAGCDD